MQIVRERRRAQHVGFHAARRFQRPGREGDLQLRSGQLLELLLDVGDGAVDFQSGSGAGLVPRLRQAKPFPRHVERRTGGGDQGEVRDYLVVVLDDLTLDQEPRSAELVCRRLRGAPRGADAAEAGQVDERHPQRRAAVPLIPGHERHRLRRLPGRRDIDLRGVLVARIRSTRTDAGKHAAERGCGLRFLLREVGARLQLVGILLARAREKGFDRLESQRRPRIEHDERDERSREQDLAAGTLHDAAGDSRGVPNPCPTPASAAGGG